MTISTNYGDLLKRQAWLQEAGAAHLGTCTRDQIRVALLTEIGELAQELKPEWAWWKKEGDAGQVDRDKVLSEAADVLHFVLLMDLSEYSGYGWDEDIKPFSWWHPDLPVAAWLTQLGGCVGGGDGSNAARIICAIIARYGFTPEDLARAYWEKTEVNLKRWGVA